MLRAQRANTGASTGLGTQLHYIKTPMASVIQMTQVYIWVTTPLFKATKAKNKPEYSSAIKDLGLEIVDNWESLLTRTK